MQACPQYAKPNLEQLLYERQKQFNARQGAAFDNAFIGAHAMSRVVLINSHPTGRMTAGKRVDALIATGGIQYSVRQRTARQCAPKGFR